VLARKLWKLLLYAAICVGVVIGILRATAIRWWRIPDDDPYLEASIAPTLRGGDLIVLWRGSKPSFGDLVVCPEPRAEHRFVIGRIAGMPGDKVQVDGPRLKVNGRNTHGEAACDNEKFSITDPNTRTEVEQTCDREDIGGRIHPRGNPPQGRSLELASLTAEPNHVLLISDNRYYPYDSRDFGGVPRESCRESVVFRLLSAKGFSDVESRFSFVW
jgi:signal peptidase I